MTTERQLHSELITGSHLYGTTTPESDLDLFRIVYPTIDELASNRHITVPHCIKDGQDVRTVILGDFVISLGTDIDRSLTALHYPDIFGELTDAWLCDEFAYTCLRVAKNMWDNAKSDKQFAHAYRVWQAHIDLTNGHKTLYPMSPGERRSYMQIRENGPHPLDWNPTVYHGRIRAGKIRRAELVDWVWERYKVL